MVFTQESVHSPCLAMRAGIGTISGTSNGACLVSCVANTFWQAALWIAAGADNVSLATRFLFGKLIAAMILVGFREKPSREPFRQALSFCSMEDSFSQIPNSIEIRESLPRPKWDLIGSWVESNIAPDSLDESWLQIARDWLARLAHSLPLDYTVYESTEFLLLGADESLCKRVLNTAERARRVILKTLDGVASELGYGKHVVLLFADVDSYYDYVSDFYSDEGEFALSGGLFVSVGYGHFAICPAYGDDYERVIVHELNHALLRHLPLPAWLDEGVTQVMEDVVLDSSYFMVDHEILRRHRAYWNADTIDMFWSGAAFHSPDDGQELSYHLSQVLFRNLMSDYPRKVNDILNNANFVDAGDAAFVASCNKSLAERASQFLGAGPWAPRSNYGLSDEKLRLDGVALTNRIGL